MSTKEGYDGAYSALSNEALENYVEDICIGIALSDDALAIRKLIARYKSDLAAKDAEIAELKDELAFWKREHQAVSGALGSRNDELAAARKEADAWRERSNELSVAYGEAIAERDALRSRIEAAPKVWVVSWPGGLDWGTAINCEECPGDDYVLVHAVLVEEEK